jgi:hypothetical protein
LYELTNNSKALPNDTQYNLIKRLNPRYADEWFKKGGRLYDLKDMKKI